VLDVVATLHGARQAREGAEGKRRGDARARGVLVHADELHDA
jgi:hypothetical protein